MKASISLNPCMFCSACDSSVPTITHGTRDVQEILDARVNEDMNTGRCIIQPFHSKTRKPGHREVKKQKASFPGFVSVWLGEC